MVGVKGWGVQHGMVARPRPQAHARHDTCTWVSAPALHAVEHCMSRALSTAQLQEGRCLLRGPCDVEGSLYYLHACMHTRAVWYVCRPGRGGGRVVQHVAHRSCCGELPDLQRALTQLCCVSGMIGACLCRLQRALHKRLNATHTRARPASCCSALRMAFWTPICKCVMQLAVHAYLHRVH